MIQQSREALKVPALELLISSLLMFVNQFCDKPEIYHLLFSNPECQPNLTCGSFSVRLLAKDGSLP